ncbi:MAG: sulfite exporter TauE/SafE family protein [Simkaniaceae bacterium]
MIYLIIASSSLLAALLTFFSGFGMGTILMPIFAIFFPVPVAIGITALVHFLNNLLKFLLLIKSINWRITLIFGGAAVSTAAFGAWLLSIFSQMDPLWNYRIFGFSASITPVKLLVGILLMVFATVELFPIPKFAIDAKALIFGGFLSGFFGGLSGHQGAFRSIFLIGSQITKKPFVATSASISFFVDLVRIIIYGFTLKAFFAQIDYAFLFIAVVFAFLGILIGFFLLKSITISFIRKIIMAMLYVLALFLISGLI